MSQFSQTAVARCTPHSLNIDIIKLVMTIVWYIHMTCRFGHDSMRWWSVSYIYIISYLKIISYSIETNYQNEVWIGLVTEYLTRLTTYKATTNNLDSKNTKYLDTTVNIGKQTSYESVLQQEGQSLTVWLSAEIWRQILPHLDTKWNFVSQINSHIIATYYLSRKWHNSKKMHLN